MASNAALECNIDDRLSSSSCPLLLLYFPLALIFDCDRFQVLGLLKQFPNLAPVVAVTKVSCVAAW